MSSRINNIAPIGSLLNKATKRPVEPMGGKRPRERDTKHLGNIRELPCIGCGREPCFHGSEAAHVSMTNAALGKRQRGIGQKSDDRWTLPLCHDCHMEQHREGEPAFYETLGIYPLIVAGALWSVRGDLEAMRKVIFNTRRDAAGSGQAGTGRR